MRFDLARDNHDKKDNIIMHFVYMQGEFSLMWLETVQRG